MTVAYEPVIGLEVHVQLATDSKIFCSCSTKFGLTPNSAVCPVCLGFPGSLPVLNRKAFQCALKVALGLNCRVQEIVKFDRKNYYYPDLPKNYQISQYDKPIAYDGSVRLMSDPSRVIAVRRVHLEEDAGKLMHDQDKTYSLVDYNRAGTPLLEIVTEPVIRSPDEAYEYLAILKSILLYLEVSDCNMEEGSLRCDANISVRACGETKLGVKAELKNMNSFKAVKAGLAYEIKRQTDLLESGGKVSQETRLWDADSASTRTMRSKEEAHDYRYFPEPDLVPFHVPREYLESVRKDLPELPAARKDRLLASTDLSEREVSVLIMEKKIADFFEAAVRLGAPAKAVSNWLLGDIMADLNGKGLTIDNYGLTPFMLAELIGLISSGTISGRMAKEILKEAAQTKLTPKELVEKKGLRQISDQGEIVSIIDTVIAGNEKSVTDYRNGKTNALMFLVGQVMKHSKGKANPDIVNRLLRDRLG
ncbi:MAG: Asp-tRNA(Asn)/Glu-tRNA(Gln) amidotransferase subunit GatB [Candidatus Omnitrophica bacterium]|nr:Asp-tRNA(Asn)/Glu-tRNA(Gln) amidotransferase subunit GatB [Candidatus Omnitrophota bacterium]